MSICDPTKHSTLTLTRRAVVPLTPLAHPEGSPRYRVMPHCGADLPDEIAVRSVT